MRSAPIVAAICRRLDRLPLALELAAARARILPLSAILDRLDQRLAFLTGGARDVPERQRTLAATIDWSYALLNDEERAAFDALAVFADGAPLDAVEHVATAPGRALDILTSLCDQSLLLSRAGDDGTPRFRMLATIREYALAALARARKGGRRSAAGTRCGSWTVAERAEPEIQGRRQARVLQRARGGARQLACCADVGGASRRGRDARSARGSALEILVRARAPDGGERVARPRSRGRRARTDDARARALRGASVLAAVAGDLDDARSIARGARRRPAPARLRRGHCRGA